MPQTVLKRRKMKVLTNKLMEEFELIAKTFMGLEEVLAQELTQLGANNVQIGRRMVSFTGNKEMMYRANFQLHTAIRVLKPIAHFKAKSAEDMYDEVKKIDWSKYILKGKTFSVDSVVYSEEFKNSRFVTYKVKDAIVDQFRENTGIRPNISVSNPDIRLNIHVAEDKATLSLDSSGESLHRRGYRQESVEAPLNEVLAAGMILMTGWKGETDFIDPMWLGHAAHRGCTHRTQHFSRCIPQGVCVREMARFRPRTLRYDIQRRFSGARIRTPYLRLRR